MTKKNKIFDLSINQEELDLNMNLVLVSESKTPFIVFSKDDKKKLQKKFKRHGKEEDR